MPSGHYPYIEIAALDAVRTRFAAGDAIAILTPELDEVIWANGPGARLFGSSDIESVIGAEPQIGFAAKRQITATSGYPRIGRDRAITVRLASGMTSRAMAFVASEIGLPGGENAILLAVPAAAGGARSPADVASRAIAGLDQAGQYAAIVDAAGGIVMASSGFERLGIATDTLAELVGEVRDDRLVKRMIAAATQSLPAGFVRLTDDPATHLLVVIDEAVPEQATAPGQSDDKQTSADDHGVATALAAISSTASASAPVPAAVDGNAAATEVEPTADVDDGLTIAQDIVAQAATGPADASAIPSQAVGDEATSGELHGSVATADNQLDARATATGEAIGGVDPVEPVAVGDEGLETTRDVAPQTDTRPDDAPAIPWQAVGDEAEPISGGVHDAVAEVGNQLDDAAPATDKIIGDVDPVEPGKVWDAAAAEQPGSMIPDTREAEPADVPVDAQPVETGPAPDGMSAMAEPIAEVHNSQPAGAYDAAPGEADAYDGMPGERPAPVEEVVAAAEQVADEARQTAAEAVEPVQADAEAPIETQTGEPGPTPEAMSPTAEPIAEAHEEEPADSYDAAPGEAGAFVGIANDLPSAAEPLVAADGAGTTDEEAAVAEQVADEARQTVAETIEPAPAAAEADAAVRIAIDRAAAPVRFVWKTDADGRFAAISEEFSAAVGASAAAVIGRSFQQVSQGFGLDPDGEIGRLLDRRDTWSGRTVLWPVAGTDLRIPVDLAALPVYDRARKFTGFRGFGVARVGDAVVDPDAAGLALLPPISSSAAPADEPDSEVANDTAAIAPPDDPFQGEVPILSIVPKQERRHSDKVIRLAEHRPPNGEKGLSPGERIAFREIGDRLKKESGTTETGTPALRGDNDQTPPAEPNDAAPLAAFADPAAAASTNVLPEPAHFPAFEPEAAETEAPESREPEMVDAAQSPAPAALEDGDETSAVEDRIAPPEIEALQAGDGATDIADSTLAQGEEPQGLNALPVAPPSEPEELAEAVDQPAQTVDAELAMHGDAELAAAEAEHLAEQDTGENGTDASQAAQNVDEPVGETAGPQSGIGAEPVDPPVDVSDQAAEMPAGQPEEFGAVAAIGDPVAQPAIVGDDQPEAVAGSVADQATFSDEVEEAGPTATQRTDAETPQSRDVDDNDAGVAEEVTSGDTLPIEPAAPIAEFADPGTYLPSAFAHSAGERVPVDTSILEQLPVPVLIHSGDALHYANREFLELTGYDTVDHLQAAGGLGELFGEPYPREDGASADDEAAPGRKLRLRTSEGLEYPVEAFLQSVPWGSGKALLLSLRRSWRQPVSFPVAATPQLTDPDLEARISEMRAIVDTATDGVILIASDGVIRSISRPAEALFGFDTAELAGKPFASLFAIESQRAARDYLNGLSENGVASILNDGREVIGREAQGRFIPLFMTIGKLPGNSGYCAVLRDITQWKRAEEELTQARAQAERASSQKTDFLARVSHEIRTPLNAIIGFSELMLDEKFGPIGSDRYRDYLRDINRSGNHVLDLVNDLLDISKIEAGQQEMSYEAVSLNDTIAETVAMMQPQANRERVIIRSSFASRLPEVVADLRSVRQIALNLLSNAVRYTQAGGQVIVSTAYESSGDVVMRVRDTGVGMSQPEIEQALKPFKQINSLKRTRGDGTGLGLPLTKAMVEANRARFMINSTPGEGTLVEITFPSTRVLAD